MGWICNKCGLKHYNKEDADKCCSQVEVKKDNLSEGAKQLIEDLADLEHQQWSHMMKFFLGLDVKTIKKNVVRWNNLANTDYKDLSEEDKEKDRVWARRVLKTQYHSAEKFAKIKPSAKKECIEQQYKINEILECIEQQYQINEILECIEQQYQIKFVVHSSYKK